MIYVPHPTPRDTPPAPCKRSCCWTPLGHSTAASNCTCHVEKVMQVTTDRYGMRVVVATDTPIADMSYPMRCLRCGCVHDAGKETVVQRYTDCSTWRCPNCNALIDDRPAGWGGSAERYDVRGSR